MTAAVVCTTAPSLEVAERIAHALVDEQLAACVQRVGPVASTYRWKGVVQSDEEFQLFIKTTHACVDSLVARLVALHPYEVPEVLVMDAATPFAAYAAWLAASVSTQT